MVIHPKKPHGFDKNADLLSNKHIQIFYPSVLLLKTKHHEFLSSEKNQVEGSRDDADPTVGVNVP